ncbi:hypothetical protein [Sporosarcina sp. FA9]|uniref:hypothetical protein n=1 Tax=Sporosarcina sp. FA9 TaxID=3413030 RepID=UPI003F655F70
MKEKNENSMKNHSTKNITSAIETLYNGSDGLMRDFIETGYFDSNVKVIDSKNIADQLITSRFKVARLREGLMEDTAKLIGWV